VELNDAARRILGQHSWLILAFVVLGVAAAALMHRGDVATYTASTRLVLDTKDPESRAESAAIADTAKAIATSPAQIRDALVRANVRGRDPIEVAEDVSVRGLGSSGILQLAVSDRNPNVAARVSNALARGLIETRLTVTSGEIQRVLMNLDRRINQLTRKVFEADAEIDALSVELANAVDPERANRLRARANEIARARDSLAQQRGVLESERVSLLSTDALRPRPSIISQAIPPAEADSSGRVPDMVLGALLGLILGVGLAGLIETVRPTLVGEEAVAKELDTPLFGLLPGEPNREHAGLELAGIAARIRLAAEAAGIRRVGLLPAGPPVDVHLLAGRLDALASDPTSGRGTLEAPLASRGGSSAAGELEPATAEVREQAQLLVEAAMKKVGALPVLRMPPTVRITPFAVQIPSLNGGGTGLILVAPATLKRADLADTVHLLRVTPLPLLGLIAYTRSRRWPLSWRPTRRREP
jgi:capsular polysaccharide biosynthesis protein